MSKDFDNEVGKEEIKKIDQNILPEVPATPDENIPDPAENAAGSTDTLAEKVKEVDAEEAQAAGAEIQAADAETQAADTEEVQEADTGEVQEADAEELQMADAGEVQMADAEEIQMADAGEVKEADAKEVQEADAEEKQAVDTEEIQEADAEEVQEADTEEVKEVDTESTAETPKKQKSQAFKNFLKRFKLPIIIAAVVLAVAAAITTTVLILNAPKFFIRDAADFAEAPNKRQVVYVLKDDITINGDLTLDNALDIDLKGHTLTINGTFNRTASGENTMNIGTVKKKQYTGAGKLVANNVNIVAADSTLNIYAASALSGRIETKQLNLFNDTAVVQNKKLTLVGTKAAVDKKISGELALTEDSALELKAAASLDKLSADGTSSAVIFGKVNIEIAGGNEISLLGGANCPSIKDVDYLYYQQATATLGTAVNVQNLFVVTQLDMPSTLNIERNGGAFKAVCSKVNNADLYVFTIKAGDELIATVSSATNECDITEYISQPKTYTISVKASGTQPRINLPSAELAVSYNYSIKLQSPVLSVSQQTDGKIMLSFPKVNFATTYNIFINGEESSVQAPDGDTVSIDITSRVRTAGSYDIKVVAASPDNSSFLDSDAVMTAYVTIKQLESPQITFEKAAGKLNVSWQPVPNAKTYVLNYGATKIVTTTTGISCDLASIPDNTVFTLQAQAIGYYQNSQTVSQTYEYTQLQLAAQPTYTFSGDTLNITMDAVAGADSYTLIINNIEQETSASAVFTTTANAGDTFKIVARAAYSREVHSDTITVAAQ